MKLRIIIKKYSLVSTIQSPGYRFLGLWSAQRPTARLGVRKTHSFQIEKMLFEDKYFFEHF